MSDKEIAEADVGGEEIAGFEGEDWDKIVRLGLQAEILDIADARRGREDKYQAVAHFLAPYGITPTRPDD